MRVPTASRPAPFSIILATPPSGCCFRPPVRPSRSTWPRASSASRPLGLWDRAILWASTPPHPHDAHGLSTDNLAYGLLKRTRLY
jgi:hypothetical protein